MKKRMLSIFMIMVTSLALTIPAFGTDNVNEDIIVFTQEEIAEQIAIDSYLRTDAARFWPNSLLRTTRVEFYAPVTFHQQTNTYYCGPACTQMVYEGITNDTSNNQAWFATQLGTSCDGTSSSQIATALTRLTGENYSIANVFSSNQSIVDMYNNIANSLEQDCAVVANVKEIPGRYTSSSGHFIVIYGSMIETVSAMRFLYVDPHYNDNYYGSFYISGENMFSAISSNAGNYVRVA